jgi:hypothetical protein
MKRIRPDLKLVVIEGESHVGVPRRPEFLAAVRALIASHGSKAAALNPYHLVQDWPQIPPGESPYLVWLRMRNLL